jgi:hypothetical protein
MNWVLIKQMLNLGINFYKTTFHSLGISEAYMGARFFSGGGVKFVDPIFNKQFFPKKKKKKNGQFFEKSIDIR